MDDSVSRQLDVLIIGAGLSGIDAAYRVQESVPDVSFAILEARHELGGTWSLFKYPGIRSDSDMYTYGYPFHPWLKANPLASGASILEYLAEAVDKFDLRKKIRYNHKVTCVEWRDHEQRWKVDVEIGGTHEDGASRVVFWTKWILTGTGYYDYQEPLKTDIPGLKNFQGATVHPQFWPEDLDYKDKTVVVIGSGATAITMVPALVNGGASSVTQLQRSPSFIMSLPHEDPFWWEKYASPWFVAQFKRSLFACVGIMLYLFSTIFPTRASNYFIKEAKRQLPADFVVDPHFTPTYTPWQQRLGLCPDGDYFQCFFSGRAHIVTDTIRTVVSDGIELNSGRKLNADIIITATGLQLKFLGGMAIKVDGEDFNLNSEYLWLGSMLTSLPNFGNLTGYWNGSWTLGCDTAACLLARLIKHQIKNGYSKVTPVISEKDRAKELPTSPMNSTYITRALHCLPKSASRGPWRPRVNYFVDRWRAWSTNLNDGLRWEKIST